MRKTNSPVATLRMTRQRKALLEAVGRHEEHPTADQVYRRVRRKLPHISLATVYRNLEILAEHGLMQRLDVGGSQKRFDADLGHHHHARCLACGRIEDVAVDVPDSVIRKARRATHYRITGHRLEFVGLCGRCRTPRQVRGKGRKGG